LSGAREGEGHRPWNILFVMTDQQRWDALGCVGGSVETPALDRLAQEGVLFSNAVTNAPGCIPARASLATGLYPHQSGVWRDEPFTLDPARPNWMRAIRDAGYSTAVFGKTHLHQPASDLRDDVSLLSAYGFDTIDEISGPWGSRWTRSNMTDEWETHGLWNAFRDDLQHRLNSRHVVRPSPLGVEYYYDTYVGRRSRAFLRQYHDPRPWFVWVSFAGPHEPWDTPGPYATRYRAGDMPAAVERPADLGHAPPGLLQERLSSTGPWNPRLEPGDIARLRANYAGEVTLIDEQIGALIDVVRERGELDRTVVAFASDHGEMNGDYGLLFKSVFLNGAVRIPLIIRTPDTARSAITRVSSAPVELMDLGITLAVLAGVREPPLGCGKSLGGVLKGDEQGVRTDALAEVRGEYMLLTDRWKIAFRSDLTPYLLFDVHEDPTERRNLAGERRVREIEEALSNRLRDRIDESRETKQ